MGTVLSGETIKGIKNVLKKDNTNLITLIMLYEHRKGYY